MNRLRATCSTQYDTFGLWDYQHFPMIVDQANWEAEMLGRKSLARHIEGGYFVPIKLNVDGEFEFELMAGTFSSPVQLPPEMAVCVVASSGEYLLRSSGNVCVGGIEYVEGVNNQYCGVLYVDPGDYRVRIHILAWDRAPGAREASGKRAWDSLPDLAVVLNPCFGSFEGQCLSLDTFKVPK